MHSPDVSWNASAQLRRVGWFLHASLVEAKLRHLERAVKTNLNPNQPRVSAGNPDGGEWTGTGGSGGGAGSGLTQVAQNEPPDRLRDIPSEKPASARLRNVAIKIVAREVSLILQAREELRGSIGHVLNLLEVASWYHEFVPLIQSYTDPPKTLEELQQAISTPALGYQNHHIVEQGPAANEGFPRSQIDAPDNLVRIPTYKHHDITGWFGKPNKEFGWLSPRDYLRGKDWTERMEVGRRTLIKHKVLKP